MPVNQHNGSITRRPPLYSTASPKRPAGGRSGEDLVRSAGFFCGCGWDTFTIIPNGNVMGCPALNLLNYTEGNIKEDDLRQIWFKRFEGFRGDIVKDLPSDCKACRHVQICRGGCWLFRAYGQDPCFLPQAEEVAAQIID